ncbi:MAG: UDP-N-acetylmuramate dehydrogenase [Chloroflexi bacterium]|nr:UDP-N-acetylmuramate dehydrogenase [Chloroflexota bacterium]
MDVMAHLLPIKELRAAFKDRLLEAVPLAPYTSARIGGSAEALIVVHNADELADTALHLWEIGIEFVILGGGSNVLVSDSGIQGLVLLNKARKVRFNETSEPPSVYAESGINFGALARQAAQKEFSGLEWAAGIPGTLGGAVFGNAGAHGGDMYGCLKVAEILHREKGKQTWSLDDLDFTYRSSALKNKAGQALVLSATLLLAREKPEIIEEKMKKNLKHRRKTQPPGASMGSMFKNPLGDYAGRLIDAAGLKGKQIGAAQISPLHGNFFINQGEASASDVKALIDLAQKTVADQFGVNLELEIELIGEWNS